ncbi:MAG: RecQ family ATP-dependent DNA helicase [Muribaculaceae bacterium]|nr:RecQ family ATP-dependent DNA helicase [Muribaculaceae bacterium]
MEQFIQKQDVVFIDTEINPHKNTIEDIGAVRSFYPVKSWDGKKFHSNNLRELEQFLQGAAYLCGHNILQFDLRYIISQVQAAGVRFVIDTLYLSALLFPKKPYHRLLKDDKLQTQELNNPLNDALKSMELFMDEVTAFGQLSDGMKKIYCTLLEETSGFGGFFHYVDYHEKMAYSSIKTQFLHQICQNVDVEELARKNPVEMAYCLAVISTEDKESIIPYWVQKNYPKVQGVYRQLRGTPCQEGCVYCRENFDIHRQLKKKFGYEGFREYNGEPLQEKAVQAAVEGKSLLAIFPTGGGKSITFQLPALMASETVSGLTVVISPLQSLMKDQVDNLSRQGLADAVTVNGLLNVIERAEALERVESGIASILYISPESLRSKTIERLLLGRNVVRFVIDEAHCFSSWGQDFRVDYLYIGDFIAQFQEKKKTRIPVSCFTATAKQKVISDIREYFKQKLNLDLELFSTNAARANLRYEVLYRGNDTEKYMTLRRLIEQKDCFTIVYVSRTKRAVEIAQKLHSDGFNAKAFHGKMTSEDKIANQEAFINGEVQIMVATSAFGMGVDKKDVKLVVHYDISDSLENYVQEAGRAGRDQNIQAECYVLFNEEDLDKHFLLLNQTRLSISEIQQVWKGIKELTRDRSRICCSGLEIARKAGWDDSVLDIETKVRTAISALETSGYVKRGQNCPRVYADSIQVRTAAEAAERIRTSKRFDERQEDYAVRIIRNLVSARSRGWANKEDAEARVDYIADHLGIEKREVIESINLMREEGILASDRDMSVYVEKTMLHTARKTTLNRFAGLERFLLERLVENGQRVSYKAMNEEALNGGIPYSTVSNIKTILYFWIIKEYIAKPEGEVNNTILLEPLELPDRLRQRFERRIKAAEFIESYFLEKARAKEDSPEHAATSYITLDFSIQELKRAYRRSFRQLDFHTILQAAQDEEAMTSAEVEEALLYLSRINAFRLEGGFLVLYNAMEITRLVLDNKIRYKQEDYRQLKEFYETKTEQIHIVGEYANMMVRDYQAALTFVNDYFNMDYRLFLTKYFKGERNGEIKRNITPMKYRKLFENLSPRQAEIINDDKSKSIVVAAGPGSGKTMILVHKLASLMLLEDVKHEQLLMLTFSRAAAMEFKLRLVDMIGNAAYFVEIKTFHSYCFDLLGKIGNLENSENVVFEATKMIQNGEVELDRITKNVLVIDEAQDMDGEEFGLVKALMERNEDMRVIAVGDDDQNIYEFRHSDSRYMTELLSGPQAKKYELTDNYRSSHKIVDFANTFVKTIGGRIKSEEIRAVKNEDGNVMVVRPASILEMSLVKVVGHTWTQKEGQTAAVLTTTNEQAYLVAELLNQRGFRARLIQSNQGFVLSRLAEVKYFLEQLKEKGPVIDEDDWNLACQRLENAFSRSKNLESCLYLFEQFAKENVKKYYTDLESFLQEAKFEDFCSFQKDEICVSTIHKAKGREFDKVYLLVSKFSGLTDEKRRSIYVGITRAKSELYLFHNTDYFESVRREAGQEAFQWYTDSVKYPEPEEIVLPLFHMDVWLGFFKKPDCQAYMKELQSGDRLRVREEKKSRYENLVFEGYIHGEWRQVARCSKDFYGRMCRQKERGYMPAEAWVQYVVGWWDKDEEKEYDIMLPALRMKKWKNL